jgi:hypothetical protein
MEVLGFIGPLTRVEEDLIKILRFKARCVGSTTSFLGTLDKGKEKHAPSSTHPFSSEGEGVRS